MPSAPGKRTPDDKKITDLLYAWHGIARQGLDASEPKKMIEDRFLELARELGVSFDIAPLLEEIGAQAGAYEAPDFMASRGEYLNGRLVAEVLTEGLGEAADLLFHLTVLLRARGLSLADAVAVLAQRHTAR